jgi:hypothetical protein
MIAAIYTRIVVAVLGLLVVATSAYAECAWALWEREVLNIEGSPPLVEPARLLRH